MEAAERAKRWSSGEGYNKYITSELNSFRKQAWKAQIGKLLEGDNLRILDIGCGPGFFSCILSEEGHTVTGIDASEGMLTCARANAEKLDVNPTFFKMDVNNIEFPDDTFDVVISRNVTWTLEHPGEVYAEFKRVLKPGGKIIIYDANWHMHFFDEVLMKKVRQREEDHFKKYGVKEIISGGDMEYFKTAPLTSIMRPQWDKKTLEALDMEVDIEEDVGRNVYEEWEKHLYAESPLFCVCATKKDRRELTENMHTYWQERSKTFGIDLGSMSDIRRYVEPFVTEDIKKVLDVGTGTGIMAATLASLGCDVTAVDLCSEMIRKAKDNLTNNGLNATFVVTQADELPFENNSFDMIVNRNLTWALDKPEETLKQWHRVLRPGGILLYLDGNHYNYLFFEEDKKNRELYTKLTGAPHSERSGVKVDYSLCDNTALHLPLSKLKRPYEWDVKALPDAGFTIIHEHIDHPQNQLQFGIARGSATNFMIVAKKI